MSIAYHEVKKMRSDKNYLGHRISNSVRSKAHHLVLLLQYWWSAEDREQFVHANGRKFVVKQTPCFGKKRWIVLDQGVEKSIDSSNISKISGSLDEYGK